MVLDQATGELLGNGFLVNPRMACRGRQVKVIRAFVADVWEKTGDVGFWTFGSAVKAETKEEVDEFCDWAGSLSRVLVGRWILVIEAGARGNRIHAHVLAEEFMPWDDMREAWARITGHPNPHVWAEAVRRDGGPAVADYCTKRCANYLRKGAMNPVWVGRRLFRSSKGLVRSLADRLAGGDEPPRLWVEQKPKGPVLSGGAVG